MFDRALAFKMQQKKEQQAAEQDYEGAYMGTLEAQAAGRPVSPQQMAMAKAYEQSKTAEVGQDLAGNLYQKYQPQLGSMPTRSMGGMPDYGSTEATGGITGIMNSMPTGQTQYQPVFSPPSPMPPAAKGSARYVNDIGAMEMPPIGDNYGQIAQMMPQERAAARGVSAPMRASPKTRQAAQEANIEVQKEGAKKTATLEAEKQFNEPKARANVMSSLNNLQNLNIDLDRAIKNTSGLTAGMGSLMSPIAGTPAADLAATLDTIQADAAFGALQTMRANSPTGGALGAVSERELSLLMNAQAALAQSQSPAQLKSNLTRYKNVRNKAIESVKKAYEEDYGVKLDVNTGKAVPVTDMSDDELLRLLNGQ